MRTFFVGVGCGANLVNVLYLIVLNFIGILVAKYKLYECLF